MAITVPATGDQISATNFGIPVANQLNSLAVTAWTNLTLLNSWTVQDGMTPRYRKVGDVVQIVGRCGGGGAGTAMFNLPSGYRHTTGMASVTAGFNGTAWDMCLLDVQTGGNIVHAQGGSQKVTLQIWYPTT